MAEHYICPVGRPTGSLSASLKKIASLVGRLGSKARLVGRIGSGVRVSTSFQNHARLVGRLGSEPRLVADMADVMFTHARVRQGTSSRQDSICRAATVTAARRYA